MKTEPVSILLVEDDDVAITGMKRVLKKQRILNPLFVAHDGIEALNLLRGENGAEPIPQPFLILLDLNMPRMNGFDFLEEVRSDERFKRSIIFVLTTSNADKDKMKAYEKNIAGYMVKENIEETFMDALAMLDRYWKIIEFPC